MSNLFATDADGNEFASKKALREFASAAPDSVRFEDTAAFGGRGVFWGIDNPLITSSDVIVGPNAWRNRKWYANIRGGKVV